MLSANAFRSPALRHPEHIHPALWRGSQLAAAGHRTIPTGFAALDDQLPGGGWPLSALVEFLPCHAGIGEVGLLCPAFARLNDPRSVALVNPPHVPHLHCWANWNLSQQLLWVSPTTLADTLWAAEQILRHNACSALVCWAPVQRAGVLRRLHLLAQQSDALVVLVRPADTARQASAAPLRLGLAPLDHGVQVTLLKRRGPDAEHPLRLPLYPAAARPKAAPSKAVSPFSHASLDQSSPALASSGRLFSPMAH